MYSTTTVFAAAAESFHVTFGEWLVSVTAILLAVISAVLVVVTYRLVKATTLAANVEMRRLAETATGDMAEVATNATEDMADLAKTAIDRAHGIHAAETPDVPAPSDIAVAVDRTARRAA